MRLLPPLKEKLKIVDIELAEANKKCEENAGNIRWRDIFKEDKEFDEANKIVSEKEEEKENLENQIEEKEDLPFAIIEGSRGCNGKAARHP